MFAATVTAGELNFMAISAITGSTVGAAGPQTSRWLHLRFLDATRRWPLAIAWCQVGMIYCSSG